MSDQAGREPFRYVECDFSGCSRVYGVTCNAEVGVTGEQKCFNTRATCQDPASFDRLGGRRFEQASDIATATGDFGGTSLGMTFVAVFKRTSTSSFTRTLFDAYDSSNPAEKLSAKFENNRLVLKYRDSSGSTITDTRSNFLIEVNTWYRVLISVDAINNLASLQVLTESNMRRYRTSLFASSEAVFDASNLDTIKVGASHDDTDIFGGEIALLYMDINNNGPFIDFGLDSNRQRVISGVSVLQDLTRGIVPPANKADGGGVAFLYYGLADDFLLNRSARETASPITDLTASTHVDADDSPVILAGTKQTLRFFEDRASKPGNIDGYPFLKGVTVTPSQIKPQEGIGARASASVQLADAPHHDRGLDPYVDERSYDPSEQGTFFSKLLARQPYYLGRNLRVVRGYLADGNFDHASAETFNYRMESMAGPAAGGAFNITAKDLLKLADNDRAKAPREATAALAGALTPAATSFTVQPAGVGNAYALSGYVRINEEVMAYTRSNDVFTITRGQYGTAAAEHALDDSVQECYAFAADTGQLPQAIVYDLLINYVDNLPPEAIDLDDWNTNDFDFVYQGIVTEPEGVTDLVNELAEQAGFYLWPNEQANRIEFRKVRPVGGNAPTFDDAANILKGSVQPEMADKLRIGAVTVYYGQRDPTESLKRKSNYRGVQTVVADSADVTKYGQLKIKEVFSRWIIQAGRASAQDTARRIAQRFGESPLALAFDMDAKDRLQLGDLFNLATRQVVDPTGAAAVRGYLLLEQNERENGTRYRYTALQEQYEPPPIGQERIVEYTTGNSFNRNGREDHDAIYNPPQGGETVRFLVPASAVVGSLDAGVPAFDVGQWPTSVTVIVEVVGHVTGKPGNGANTSPSNLVENGGDGGTALYTRRPITLVYTNGRVWGGGGGGGAGAACRSDFVGVRPGGGGGGGAGIQLSAGGLSEGGASQDGEAGTLATGGQVRPPGGASVGEFVFDGGGSDRAYAGDGGAGGGPGLPGEDGKVESSVPGAAGFDQNSSRTSQAAPPTLGGSAGLSIDGLAFVTVSGAAGDLRGPTA